ncbi:nitrate reductase molybdenum cofactor assembly chaperone [Kordiimonas sp.]|uniref:nitrate reductase molybdenum cofactor assembly chaperone n=1 Tax=Kordiimonas sp. TaxID=1970157 RepID=UPI003A8ECEBF
MNTIKLLGMLLSYPSVELQQHAGEIREAIAGDGLLPAKLHKPLFALIDDLGRRNLLRLQEEYVATFDRSRVHSLYLFEHVHGESRDRGQAMVDLMGLYKTAGIKLAQRELPDYLPVFLEFLSLRPFDEAQDYLGEVAHILEAIGAKLKLRKNPYQHVFRALVALTNVKIDPKFVEQAVEDARREDTSLAALDKEWEETPAFDGIGADCSVCPQGTPAKPRQTATH